MIFPSIKQIKCSSGDILFFILPKPYTMTILIELHIFDWLMHFIVFYCHNLHKFFILSHEVLQYWCIDVQTLSMKWQFMFLMPFRALNVFDEHGIPVSEIHEAQRSAVSQGLGELRFPNSCVLWVQSDQNGKTVWKATTLQPRLYGQIP